MKKNTKKIKNKNTDYSVYTMNLSERMISLLAGGAGGTAAGAVLFGNSFLCAAAGAAGVAAGLRAGRDYFRKKRDRMLMLQFRDFLESLSASLSAGQNVQTAIESSGRDMQIQYGENSMIAGEICTIINGIKNGRTAEEMFDDLGVRSARHDIKCFADTFSVCNRTGGNMKQVISGAHRIISEKMQMQSEIASIASKGKNDLRIMTCLPFVIIPMMNMLGGGMNGTSSAAVRAAGAAVIALAYAAGSRIADIKI